MENNGGLDCLQCELHSKGLPWQQVLVLGSLYRSGGEHHCVEKREEVWWCSWSHSWSLVCGLESLRFVTWCGLRPKKDKLYDQLQKISRTGLEVHLRHTLVNEIET